MKKLAIFALLGIISVAGLSCGGKGKKVESAVAVQLSSKVQEQ